MGLMEKILSSLTQTREVSVQPYQAVTDTPNFGNRNWSPQLVSPGVSDAILTSTRPEQVARNEQIVYSSPVPVVLQNGAAPTNGNNAPGRRG